MRILLSVLVIGACATADSTEETDQAATTTPSLTLARTDVTDGYVAASASDGKTLYLGGNFHYIGERSGELVQVRSDTGVRDHAITELGGGGVFAIVPDGSGGYFLGGDFRKTGSFTNRAIARLRADGTYDPAWRFEVQGAVYALAADSKRLYVGGSFASINGQARRNFAAFDIATGAMVANTPSVGAMVRCMSLSPSTGRLFVGGDYDGEGGLIERIDVGTMTVSSWNPGTPDGSIESLLAYGSGLYVGGGFTHFGSVARTHMASIDQSTAVVRPYNPSPDQAVLAMQRAGSVLYIGGNFANVAGQPRAAFAALDASTGALLPLNVALGGDFPIVRSILATANAIYIGGWFKSANGSERKYAAAIDPSTGAVLPWNPHASQQVMAILPRGSSVLLGGLFISVNGSDRTNFAAIDLATGKATSWAPATGDEIADNDYVTAMALRGTTLWVGGRFTSLNGQPRANLGALSTNGDLLSFRADTNDVVNAIAATKARIYVGGRFTTINDQSRSFLGAVDPTTGATLSWAGSFGRSVNAIVVAGPRLYAGGFGLGAWDVNSVAQPVPAVDGSVDSLAWDGTTVYVGGQYQHLGGQARNGLAATVPGTETVTSWNPAMPAFRDVLALGVSPSYVYTSDFGTLRTFSKSTGALQTFSPKNGGGTDYIVLPDRLLITGVGEVNYIATGGVAEFLGTP